jgi:hypothetical protein
MFAFIACVLFVWAFASVVFGALIGLTLAVATAGFLGWKALTTDWFV